MDTKFPLSIETSERQDGAVLVRLVEHRPNLALCVLITLYKSDERHLIEPDLAALGRMPNDVRAETIAMLKRRLVREPIVYGEADAAPLVAVNVESGSVDAEKAKPVQIGFDDLWG